VRWFPFVLLAVLAVLLQTTVLRVLGGARPDLMVGVLVPACLGVRRADGFGAGCVVGLLRDLFSVEPFGLSTGVFAVLGYGLARLRPSVYAEHPITHALFGLLCSALVSGASGAALLAQGGLLRPGPAVAKAAAIAAATAVLTGLVGALIWRRPKWLGLRRGVEFEGIG
jgi:rod shape-determining protein MreD